MLTEKDITEELLHCQAEREKVEKYRKTLRDWCRQAFGALKEQDSALRNRERLLRELPEARKETEQKEKQTIGIQLELDSLVAFPSEAGIAPPPTYGSPVTGERRKPAVQVIEEILQEYGPLHVADITALSRACGVQLDGKKRKPQQIIKDKLATSKRFYLVGNNVWGLPHHAAQPETVYQSRNGATNHRV